MRHKPCPLFCTTCSQFLAHAVLQAVTIGPLCDLLQLLPGATAMLAGLRRSYHVCLVPIERSAAAASWFLPCLRSSSLLVILFLS